MAIFVDSGLSILFFGLSRLTQFSKFLNYGNFPWAFSRGLFIRLSPSMYAPQDYLHWIFSSPNHPVELGRRYESTLTSPFGTARILIVPTGRSFFNLPLNPRLERRGKGIFFGWCILSPSAPAQERTSKRDRKRHQQDIYH